MKMTYRPGNNSFSRRPEKKISRLFSGLAVVAVVVIFGSLLVQGLTSPVLYLTYPLFRITNQLETNVKTVEEFITSQRRLLAQMGVLRQQVATLKEENKILKLKDQILTGATGFSLATSSKNFIALRILSRPSASPYDTLIVDTSSVSNKIKVNQLVFSAGGVALGRVDIVAGNSARVALFSSPGHKLAVQIGGEHTAATAEGLGGGNFKIVLPRGVMIKVGDPVIAPAESDNPIGVVGAIDSSPADPFQIIYFKSPINLYELVWIFIKV